MRRIAFIVAIVLSATRFAALAQPSPSNSPVSVNVYERARIDAWQWFAAPPATETYGYVESLLRISMAQRIKKWDWMLEMSQAAVLDAPSNAVSSVTAQGQLGLGGTYYASSGNNSYPAAAFLKQGFVRYHFPGVDRTLRLGRIEFVEGVEIKPKDPTLLWLQLNRMQQRVIGNFGFANAQRSFDGLDAHYGGDNWDITAMAGRATQGVFNMNGNPELNVDAQYLAFSRQDWGGRLQWRGFAVGYHDGRTGLTKTDNRPLAVRQTDHKNIRIGTYGGDLYTSVPTGAGSFDLLLWGALQNGSWGELSHSAGAGAVEAGYQLTQVKTSPWLRGGFFHSTGDDNPSDNEHHTFFGVLPTPRVYARNPMYNLMNNQDSFVQIIDRPSKKLELRSDLHWVQLSSGKDLWYQGGGAFDNKVFGFTGRPGNGHTSFDSMWDISSDWQATHNLAVNFYYAYTRGKRVVSTIYPTDSTEQFGYAEFVYRWGVQQRSSSK